MSIEIKGASGLNGHLAEYVPYFQGLGDTRGIMDELLAAERDALPADWYGRRGRQA